MLDIHLLLSLVVSFGIPPHLWVGGCHYERLVAHTINANNNIKNKIGELNAFFCIRIIVGANKIIRINPAVIKLAFLFIVF